MKWTVVLTAVVVALLSGMVPPASADFSWTYPDESLGIELGTSVGFGTHAAVFWDMPGDFDIFTFHADGFNNELKVSVEGLPSGFAYWLDFQGTDAFDRLVYDVFITTGGSFFFVTTIAF
jgi:hypothetical protein